MIGKLSHESIDEVLKRNILGRIGCNDGQKTYVVPINYVFDGRNIIAHAVDGMKVQMMRQNPNVCFEVDEMQDNRNWKCVILWGSFVELIDERERLEAMKLFVERMMYLKISETAVPPETSGTRIHPRARGIKPIIYRIVINEKSGRYELS